MNIIEELFYGNIDPNVKTYSRDSSIFKAVQVVSDNEDKLIELLEGKEKSLFLNLVNAQSEILGTSEAQRFVEGFQLGARFMLDTFLVSQNNILKDIV